MTCLQNSPCDAHLNNDDQSLIYQFVDKFDFGDQTTERCGNIILIHDK
jgi:hypothetical protein